MKEIVFSDSTKGSMKVAQRWDPKRMQNDGPTAVFGNPSKETFRRFFEGEALGGSSRDVLGLSFLLDMGDISGDIAGKARAEEIRRLWHWISGEDEFQQYIKSNAEDLERAKTAARNGEKLRVWISDAPASACGLRHLLWEIRDCDCVVSVVELPKYWDNDDGTVTMYTDWGEVQPGHFARFTHLERELGRNERRVMAFEWAELVRENAPLRAMVNGKLLSVPENFYDHLLYAHMPEEPFHMARLIGEVLGRHPLGVGDSWYALRLRTMIDRGELTVVEPGKKDRPYSMILCKPRR